MGTSSWAPVELLFPPGMKSSKLTSFGVLALGVPEDSAGIAGTTAFSFGATPNGSVSISVFMIESSSSSFFDGGFFRVNKK